VFLILVASSLLWIPSVSLAGQNCVGPRAQTDPFLLWVKRATRRAVRGVMVEEARAAGAWTFPICGAPNNVEPGYVPHGDPLSNGTAVMEINNDRLTISIDLGNQRYDAHHAHLYSTTSGYINDDIGASTVCWAYDNLTPNNSNTAPYNEKALSATDWPYPGGYAESWYMSYLSDIDAIGGGEWFVMVHMLGGHFAVDDEGHLIEWNGPIHEVAGDADVAGNFYGDNDVVPSCNARHGRRLNDKRMTTGSCLTGLGQFNTVDDYFLDQNGVAWLDEDGDLTPLAVNHSYDLTTRYVFYSFADEGLAEQYGGPEGGAGGFINGYDGERCDNWPPTEWGEPHPHTVPEPSGLALGFGALLFFSFLRQRPKEAATR
jgi:hypothetical protein